MKKKIWLYLFLLTLPISAMGRTANQVYRMPGSGNVPTWGQIDLGQSAAVTGTLAIGRGGTGQTSFSSGAISSNGSALTSGTLSLGNGGTGITACANTAVPYSDGTKLVCGATDLAYSVSGGSLMVASLGLGFGGSPFLRGYSANTALVQNSSQTISRPIVVSASPSSNGMMIIRGNVNSAGAASGEGFSSNRGSTGTYTVTYTAGTFLSGDTPIPVVTVQDGASRALFPTVTAQSTSAFTVTFVDTTSTLTNIGFNFHVSGQLNN